MPRKKKEPERRRGAVVVRGKEQTRERLTEASQAIAARPEGTAAID